jgi:hypothetical protein
MFVAVAERETHLLVFEIYRMPMKKMQYEIVSLQSTE